MEQTLFNSGPMSDWAMLACAVIVVVGLRLMVIAVDTFLTPPADHETEA